MSRCVWTIIAVSVMAGNGLAQDFSIGGPVQSASEPLYQYDDLEVWKHGWIQIMPYYGGYHSYRPYNYKNVFSQSAQSAAWGMSPTAPYSQQFYHRYESITGAGVPMSAIQNGEYGPHPSVGYQPQWGQLQQTQPVVSVPSTYGLEGVPPTGTYPAIETANFQNIHAQPAAGPEYQRINDTSARMQYLLEQSRR
ncbi:MAG: hypothetical protein KDA93_18440 [Planctomycetaceae bacterium]|nr:hypothetical protein [Planctomycetaceae bacterium]